MSRQPPAGFALAAVAGAAATVVISGCGASKQAATTPSPTPSSAAPASRSPTPAASPGATAGAKTASCTDGWMQPASGTALFQQATAALEQSQGGTGYTIGTVRSFTGPIPGGGVGAIYYLDVRDTRLSARVLLVSGAGPAEAAVAKTGTMGWKQGDWTGFRGDQPAAHHPPLPGRWSGPEFDPIGGTPPLLAPSIAGCLEGS